MGSPLGTILANIFVGHCESLAEQREREWPSLYNRFVNDIRDIHERGGSGDVFQHPK